MARDRLAALRARQDNATAPNSYPPQAAGSGSGSQAEALPQTQRDNGSYEMADSRGNAPATTGGSGMSGFYNEISSIQDALRTFNDNVVQISDLHSHSLNNMGDTAAQQSSVRLNKLVEETSALGASLKRRVKATEAQGGQGRDGQIKKQQAAFIKSKFVEAIQNYQSVEQQYRSKYKERMERQFKIVKPNATPNEIRAVVDDEQGGQIFTQAFMNSRYTTESRAAYREVQERHEDVKRIERTLADLAQLSNDMSVLAERQDETLNDIHRGAADTEGNVEEGAKHTEKAVKSARSYRKMRFICFGIVLVFLIIGVVIGLAIWLPKTKKQ